MFKLSMVTVCVSEIPAIFIQHLDDLPYLFSFHECLQFNFDAANIVLFLILLLKGNEIFFGIFTKAALSRITGINERQLWHYAAGVHKPRRKQAEKIQQGIQSLTKELESISLV